MVGARWRDLTYIDKKHTWVDQQLAADANPLTLASTKASSIHIPHPGVATAIERELVDHSHDLLLLARPVVKMTRYDDVRHIYSTGESGKAQL